LELPEAAVAGQRGGSWPPAYGYPVCGLFLDEDSRQRPPMRSLNVIDPHANLNFPPSNDAAAGVATPGD
jgi:hypothetical protein